jgi:hypothetical protein
MPEAFWGSFPVRHFGTYSVTSPDPLTIRRRYLAPLIEDGLSCMLTFLLLQSHSWIRIVTYDEMTCVGAHFRHYYPKICLYNSFICIKSLGSRILEKYVTFISPYKSLKCEYYCLLPECRMLRVNVIYLGPMVNRIVKKQRTVRDYVCHILGIVHLIAAWPLNWHVALYKNVAFLGPLSFAAASRGRSLTLYIHLINPSPSSRTFLETKIPCASNYFYSVLQTLLLPLCPPPNSSCLFLSRSAPYLPSRPLFCKYFLKSGWLWAIWDLSQYWTESKSETWNQHEEGPVLRFSSLISHGTLK